MLEKFSDVVVLGAGPAGSATALFLARAGYDVVLLDRAAFPRDKPCGEYLTPGAVKMLRDEIGVLPEMLTLGARWLDREAVVPHTARSFSGPTEALACPRVITDRVLLDQARAAGVRVTESFAARNILKEGGRICGVQGTGAQGDEQTTYRARVVVGADGTHSLLAREMGVVRPIPRLQRIALVTHYAAAESVADSSVTMHLPGDSSDACCGVGAPCGPGMTQNVNIVVPITEAKEMAGRRQEYFEERLRRSFPQVWEQVSSQIQVGPLHSIGCFGHHTKRAADDSAVLVGDAATFIHPFTGEGVFFALRGAQLAAETINLGFQKGDLSRRSLQNYDAARHAELLPRYRLCDAVQHIVHSPALLAWAAARLRRSVTLTEVLLQTIGDRARPADLFTLPNLRLALSTL